MKYYYGVSNGEQGYGVGDIITGIQWRKRSDMVELLNMDNEWVEVFSVFTCQHLNVVY